MSGAAPQRGLLATWEDAHQVLVVPMGQVYFVDFQQTPAIGTHSLGSCSVAIIASEFGGILAHVPPLPLQPSSQPEPHAGDNNIRTMMNQVRNFYTYYRDLHYFPVSSTHVICASYRSEVALPDQLAIMRDGFMEMGLEPATNTYAVPGNRAIPGQGTVIAISSSGPGELPSVYVEDDLVGDGILPGKQRTAPRQAPELSQDTDRVNTAEEPRAADEYSTGLGRDAAGAGW